MLERFTQVGEFYVMTCPENVKTGAFDFMDILIYDEEKDRHVKIGFRRALLATGMFTESTTAGDLDLVVTTYGDNTDMDAAGTKLSSWKTNAKALEEASRGGTVPSADAKSASLVLARPFIEHAMLSAVMAVSGGDTGATVFGPSDMQISVRVASIVRRLPVTSLVLTLHSPFVRRRTPRSRQSKGTFAFNTHTYIHIFLP